jgi:hypothetical protein
MGTGGSFPGGKAAGVQSWPLTSNYCRGQKNVGLYIHSPIHLHGVVPLLAIMWLIYIHNFLRFYMITNILQWWNLNTKVNKAWISSWEFNTTKTHVIYVEKSAEESVLWWFECVASMEETRHVNWILVRTLLRRLVLYYNGTQENNANWIELAQDWV